MIIIVGHLAIIEVLGSCGQHEPLMSSCTCERVGWKMSGLLINAIGVGTNMFINETLQPLSRKTGRIFNKPTSIYLAITDECIMRCQMCDMWKLHDGDGALTTEQKINIIVQVFNWLGPFRLSFTGGEPLKKLDELCRLARYCADRGIITSTNTAGLLLREKTLDKIVDSGLSLLLISLDSLREDIHDVVRGRPGTCKTIMRAIEYLAKRRGKMRVATRAVISRHNIGEIVSMVKWAKDVGLDGIGFHPLEAKALFGNIDEFKFGWQKEHPMWPEDHNEVTSVLEQIIELKKAGYPVDTPTYDLESYKAHYRDPSINGNKQCCYVGVKNFIIDIYGNVKLCFSMNSIGNVLTSPVHEIWRSREARRLRQKISLCKASCGILACNRRSSVLSKVVPYGKKIVRQ